MRRRFKSGSENPLTGDSAGNRGSEKLFEMRKAKRVRFVDTEMDGHPVYASSRGRKEAAQSARADAPKTSEYAYFTKIKNGAGLGHTRSLHKENEHLKSSETSYHTREIRSTFDKLETRKDLRFSAEEIAGPSDHNLIISRHITKDDEPEEIRSTELTSKTKKRSPFLPKNVTPVGQSVFLSPLNEASENSELTNKIKRRSTKSFLSENVTPVGHSLFSSPLKDASEKSENQFDAKGIFSAKRHRLRQWVAHTSFPEAEKLHPKGFDLVSALLSRLFPKGNENNDSSKGDTDNKISSTFLESSNPEKGLQLLHKRDWDKDFPKICSGRATEIAHLDWGTIVPGFPFPNYGTKSHVQDELDLDQCSKSFIQRSSHTQHPFERYRPPGFFHLKELDEFGSITEDAKGGLHRLLLGRDFDCGKDIADSSIINHDTARNVYSRLATSWNIDEQGVMDTVLDPKRSCSSTLFPNYFVEPDSSHNHVSARCLSQNFGPNSYDKKCAMAQSGWFSLPLPSSPKCIILAEDRNAENLPYNSDIIFSYGHHHWLDDNVSDGKPLNDVWWKCLPAADFSAWQCPENRKSLFSFSMLEEAPREPFFPLCEGALKHHISPSNCLSAAEDPPSIFHAWQFPENEKSLCSLSKLEEAPAETFTRLYEADFSLEDPSSNFHAWQFPQSQKSLYTFPTLEGAPRELFAPSYKGAFNHHILPSHDTLINRPLLLNHVSLDRPEQELYSDDDDNKLEYKYLL